MMDDVIYRQDVLNLIPQDISDFEEGSCLAYDVGRLPSAQKKGHWVDEGTNYSCSECHRGCWVNSNYCPWCGAQMDGKDGDQNG